MVLYVLSHLTFEVPSMGQNTSNQTPPTQNPSGHTGGAASFSNANLTGGDHAFGSKSTVNNTQDYSKRTIHDNSNNKGIIGGGSNNTVNSGDNSGNTVNNINYGPDANEVKEHQLITTLPRAEAGRKVHEYKKQSGPCFPGTRQSVLQKMKDWATDPNEFGMYVLSGLAGIGKSTVAYTIAAWADDPKRHLLGAEFFFSRDEADRSSAKLFFTTIAYDLYFAKSKAFKRAIGEALVTKGKFTASPQEQLDALILDPLKPIRNDLPSTLIVVDALDECGHEARFVLTGLQQLVQALPSFKVILTTRPEALSNIDSTTQKGRKVFRLHDIEADVVNEDIRIYLKYYLSVEQVKEGLPDLTKQWCASDAQVERLIQASGKLFIMASTAVRYILDTFSYAPDSQMKELLDAFAQGRTPFDNLVDFYTIILRSAIPDKCHDRRLVERYQAIVGTIVLAQVPLSVHSIASLMHIDVDQIFAVLRQLQSVISVADNTPRAYHKSFVDYITDSKQCEDINLRIDPTKRHTWIARRCFEMMGKHLKFNILELGIPARFMSNEEGLATDGISDERLQEKIPLVLQYACAYWDGHLNNANIDDADLVKELEKFDKARVLLPWFEVLSFIRKLDSAHRAIRVALKVLNPTPSDFCQLLSDGLRFISKFYEIIERSALQTYYSALLFTPTDSLLYRRFINEALHRGCNVIGIQNQWDTLVANVRHGPELITLQFSLDSTMFVSWNYKMLKVWDAVTGTPISTFKRHCSFAIANDFSTVASFENNAIKLYNVDGSEQGATFKLATSSSAMVHELAISSESLGCIAAGLSDGTVSLWDTRDQARQDGKPISSFGDYQSDGYHCLEFSATGARLAYSSAKKGAVKLWDVMKREFVADLDWASHGFAFSRDGSRIVSWQKESGVKLWDCGDGQPIGTIEKRLEYPFAVSISDNGSLLAIGCLNNVTLWGVKRGNLSQVVDLDLDDNPRLLAFSRDDTLAIAVNSYVKLYSIKNRSFLSTFSISFCPVLAFSPDCTRFVVGYHNGTLSLLDTRVIESSSRSSNQQGSRRLTAFALSWNCSRVACGFEDGAVELWETDGFPKRQIATHRHHQRSINTLGFSHDGRQFASGSDDGTISLWDGEDGARRGVFQYSSAKYGRLYGVEVSNNGVLAAVDNLGMSLWDCKTLDRIQRFHGFFATPLSFSADGALLAVVAVNIASITVFDVTSHTAIATFKTDWAALHMMGFLPDNSQLVVWRHKPPSLGSGSSFLTLNIGSQNGVIQGPSFDKFIQLPDMPLWHGVPVWVNEERRQYYLEALFSQHDDPVPVLWIPRELDALEWVQRRSMIAIRCKDGRVVLLRLPATATATAARAGYDNNLSYGTPAQQTVAAALPSGQNVHVPATALVRSEVREDEGLEEEEASGYTSGEFGSESQRLSPSSHKHGMYTTDASPLPSQRQESPAPAPRHPPALPPRRREGPALVPPHIPPRRRGPLVAPAPSVLNLSGDFR